MLSEIVSFKSSRSNPFSSAKSFKSSSEIVIHLELICSDLNAACDPSYNASPDTSTESSFPFNLIYADSFPSYLILVAILLLLIKSTTDFTVDFSDDVNPSTSNLSTFANISVEASIAESFSRLSNNFISKLFFSAFLLNSSNGLVYA